jgi:hypothetical protein
MVCLGLPVFLPLLRTVFRGGVRAGVLDRFPLSNSSMARLVRFGLACGTAVVIKPTYGRGDQFFLTSRESLVTLRSINFGVLLCMQQSSALRMSRRGDSLAWRDALSFVNQAQNNLRKRAGRCLQSGQKSHRFQEVFLNR